MLDVGKAAQNLLVAVFGLFSFWHILCVSGRSGVDQNHFVRLFFFFLVLCNVTFTVFGATPKSSAISAGLQPAESSVLIISGWERLPRRPSRLSRTSTSRKRLILLSVVSSSLSAVCDLIGLFFFFDMLRNPSN